MLRPQRNSKNENFETSQEGNLKFINKTICINSTKNIGLDAYCHGIKLFTNCNPSKLSVMIAGSEWMFGLKIHYFWNNVHWFRSRRRRALGIAGISDSEHFQSTSTSRPSNGALFNRDCLTTKRTQECSLWKLFKVIIVVLTPCEQRREKDEFARAEEIASSGFHHKDVLLSGHFLFSFSDITHSGKYLTVKVTDGMSEGNNAIFSCLFLHGNGDQIKNVDPRSLTFVKPAPTIIIFSQSSSFKIFCARPKNLSFGMFASRKIFELFNRHSHLGNLWGSGIEEVTT